MTRGASSRSSPTARQVIRPGLPRVRTTYQFVGHLLPADGESAGAMVGAARRVVLDWLANKFPAPLPKAALAGESFGREEHGQTLHGVAIREEGLWSVRLVQPDAPSPYGDREAVPGRVWTTEICLAESEASVRVAVRTLCASLPFAEAPITLTRPRMVVDLARRFDLRDVRPIDGTHWAIQDDDDVAALHDLVCNPARALPVFVLTQPDERRLGISVRDYLLDHEALAKRLLGLGLVVTLPREQNWAWTDLVGKTWSTFLGAVRTYRPGLDFEQDSPGNHPLALPERILAFHRDGKIAEEAFIDFLVEQAYELAATKPVRWDPCLFYADALQRDVEVSRSRAGQDADWKALYEQEVDALTKRAEEAEGLAQSYAEDKDQLRAALEQVEAENQSIRAYADALRIELGRKGGDSVDASVPLPDSYDEMSEWIEQHLPGRVMLHPRAIRSLKRAAYEDVELVYRAVLALGTEYRDMRCGLDGAKEKWEAKLADLGLQFGGSISRERAGQEGETYFVKYPLGSNANVFLEYHLRKGSTKDDRMCLAIYFFWDDDKQRVVVGSLPAHLQNRMT